MIEELPARNFAPVIARLPAEEGSGGRTMISDDSVQRGLDGRDEGLADLRACLH